MRHRTIVAALAIVGTAYFGLTAARDLGPFDSAEFALNAAQLGVGHPPGQPAYTLLAAALVRVVPASPAAVLAWLSALSMVAASLLALRIALATTAGAPAKAWLPATVVALWLVPGVWDLATRAEVYATATALLLAASGGAGRAPLGRGVLLGLAASVNPAMALPFGLLIGLQTILDEKTGRVRSLALIFAGGIVGLLPYGWLPIAGGSAAARGALVWGAPLRGPALWQFLVGQDYRSWQLDGGELVANLGRAVAWSVRQGIAPWAVLGGLGAALSPQLGRVGRVAPSLLTVCGLLQIAANHPFVPSNPDYAGYLLPSLLLDVLGVALLLERLAARRRWSPWAMVATLALLGAVAGPWPWARARGGDRPSLVRELAARVLAEAPRDAVLLLESDHLVFPCLMLQEVEGVRRDVVVLDHGWASSRWFWDHLAVRHPSLAPAINETLARPPGGASVLPPREARVAAFLDAAHRPVAAETLRLATLAGGRPCRGRWLALGGASCGTTPRPRDDVAGDLAALVARHARPGTLEERLLSHTALARADDAWLDGDAVSGWRILRAGVLPAQLAGLPLDGYSPRRAAPFAQRTPLTEPRALASPEVVLLRLGDIASADDAALAAALWLRADIPEADRRLR